MLKVLCLLETLSMQYRDLRRRSRQPCPRIPAQHTLTQDEGADSRESKKNDTLAMSYSKRPGVVAITKGHSSVTVPKVLSPPLF